MTWIVGAAQAAMGIYGLIKSSQDEAEVDKIKKPVVPKELYENKMLAKSLYSDLGSDRDRAESQARDLAKRRETINAGSGLGPGGRLQADVASNIQTGYDVGEIYQNYRKAYADVVKTEMGTNQAIARGKEIAFSQGMDVSRMKQDMYNMRQSAWGELLNAGISNTAGAIQSNSNDKLMRDVYGLDPKSVDRMTVKATKSHTKGNLSNEDFAQYTEYIKAGQYNEAELLLERTNTE
jgi:hypothetical protein